MSYTVINNSLLRELDVKGNTQLLLIHLISYESKEFGYAYPTLPTLLKDTGLSRNTILKCLNELEEKGYIKRVKEKGINNKYYINSSVKFSSTENDTTTSVKIDTSIEESSIKNDTRGSIKFNTLQITNKNNNKKEKEKTNIDKIINAYTENNSLVEAIKDFIKMRKTIKKPITDRGLKMILNKLDQYGNDDLEKIEILENSIMNCWQGVFELKNKKVPSGIGTQNKNINVNPSICTSRRKYTQACDIG